MHQFDLKDRRLLYELDTNSRQSYHQLARKIGLSKDAIIYRINRLKEKGIIQHFHTIIDVGKLGFTSFRLYLKLQNTTPEKEKEIIHFLKQQKKITWLASIDGDYDLGMWILVKDVTEMNVLWKCILSKFNAHIADRNLTIFTDVAYYPRSYFLNKKVNNQEYVFISEPETPDVDDKDLHLLKLIAPDSRVSVLSLARRVKLTPKTVTARLRHMEKTGVIVGYRTLFDMEKIGYQHFKIDIMLEQKTKEKQIREYARQHPNYIYDNQVLGGYDIEIELQAKSVPEFRKLLADLKEHFSDTMRKYRYMLFYKEHKFLFFPT